MPIQHVLSGVTFPGSNLVNVNTLKNPLQYFGSQLKMWTKADAGVTTGTGLSEAITSSSITGNVGTVGLSIANVNSAYANTQHVTFAGIQNATALNGTFPILSLGASSISVAINSANVSSAAEASATVTPTVVTDWVDQGSFAHSFNVIGDAAWPGPALATYTSQINASIVLPCLSPVAINGPHRGFLKQTYSADLDFAASTPFSVVMAVVPGLGSGAVYPNELGTISGSANPGPGWSLCSWQTSTVKQPTFRLVNARGTAECSVSTNASITPGTPVIIHAVNAGTGTAAGLSMFINGVQQATTTLFDNLAGATTVTGLPVGVLGAASAGGGIGTATFLEAFIVNKAMTQQDVTLLDAYLNAKWAIHP